MGQIVKRFGNSKGVVIDKEKSEITLIALTNAGVPDVAVTYNYEEFVELMAIVSGVFS